jgi:putative methionine-R-sulfoxide reductase with GAF domain
MRWLVEVTSLGTTEKESLHVDAETWQKALHTARAQRGDPGPMSGFSIELLDEGCRAVDPGSRTRYEVRRAAEPTRASAPPPPLAQPVQPPIAPAAPIAPVASAPAAPMTAVSTRPVAPAAPLPPTVPTISVAPRPAASASHAPAAPVVVPTAPVVIAQEPVALAVPATLRADVAANVPSQIVFKREQDATEALPLTYREYVYNVPPTTSEAAAETLLTTQLEFVRASLERVPAGKLVNLAAVDAPVDAKPAPPPLATLTWKDWRGPPVVTFPRRPGGRTAPAAAPVTVAAPVFAPQAVAAPAPPVAFVPPPAPVFAQAPAPAMAPAPISPPAAVFAPAPAANPAPPPAPVFAAPAFPATPAVVVPAQPFAPAFTPPAPFVRSAPPLRTGGPSNGRVRGEDLIADLFEAMHDLHFLRDALEGGEFCLTLAMEKLPSQAGIVHLYDINHREFLVTSTRGVGTGVLLTRRVAEGDTILSSAMRKRKPLVFADAAQTEAATVERYIAIGGARSVIVAPVEQGGRFLGAIEILNPLDGQPFTEAEGNAIMYIAEQLAEFVSQRGVVTDPERIAARQIPGA